MPRTRFQRGDQADSDCTPFADVNKPLLDAQTGGDQTVTITLATQTMNVTEGGFFMAAGDPGSGEDLASGLWRAQLDILSIGSFIEVRIRFVVYNDACAEQANQLQDEGVFTATGLALGTTTWDPAAGDRYGFSLFMNHTGGHSDPAQSLVLTTNNSDAFFEIPDAPVAGQTRPRIVVARRAAMFRSSVH